MSDRIYRLYRYGNLLISRGAIGDNEKTKQVRLLVDTGSSYTVLRTSILTAIGGEVSDRQERIMTPQGMMTAPVIIAPWFSCFGRRVDRFPIVAHDLPSGAFVQGLLGMDFLTRFDFDIIISLREGLVRYRQEE
ncbi:MAG: aspartyl protease family protein [Limnospira sp.]